MIQREEKTQAQDNAAEEQRGNRGENAGASNELRSPDVRGADEPVGRLEASDSALLKQFVRTESALFSMAQEKAREAEALAAALRIIQGSRVQVLRSILTSKYGLDADKDYRIDENDVIWLADAEEAED